MSLWTSLALVIALTSVFAFEARAQEESIQADERKLSEYRMQLTDEHPRVQQLIEKIEREKAALAPGSAGFQPAKPPASERLPQPVNAPIVQLKAEGVKKETRKNSNVVKTVSRLEASAPSPEAPKIESSHTETPKKVSRLEASAPRTIAPKSEPSKSDGAIWWLFSVLPFIAVAIFRRLLSTAVTRVDDVHRLLPLPVVGWINQLPTPRRNGEILPGLHKLRTNLRRHQNGSGQQIVITSPDSGAGKSILASALAINLAESGLSVTLLDANFQNPSAQRIFCLPEGDGLAEHLASADGSDAASFKHRVKHNLHVIPCGRSPVHSGIFDSHSFQKLREDLVASNDVVIYDSDATSQSLDALALLDQDAYLLIVVRMQHTKTESLKFLSGYLRQQKFSSGGLVFFGASERAMVKALNWRHA